MIFLLVLKYNLNFALINSKDFGGRFIERDRLEYGLISKVTDGDYYTNGSNIPKHYECDLAHKAKVEAPYHRLCLAGNSYLVNTKETLEENRQIIDLLDKDIYEKDINLIMCKKIEQYLISKGATVYLTRESDIDLSTTTVNKKRSDLTNRAKLINKSNANMYISIHLNYISNTKWKGLQIFYNNRIKENEIIATKLTQYIREKTYNVKDPKLDNTYYMYKRINTPGVLIELGFLSNPDDRYRLTHEEYQDKLIDNLTYAIESYFAEKD